MSTTGPQLPAEQPKYKLADPIRLGTKAARTDFCPPYVRTAATSRTEGKVSLRYIPRKAFQRVSDVSTK